MRTLCCRTAFTALPRLRFCTHAASALTHSPAASFTPHLCTARFTARAAHGSFFAYALTHALSLFSHCWRVHAHCTAYALFCTHRTASRISYLFAAHTPAPPHAHRATRAHLCTPHLTTFHATLLRTHTRTSFSHHAPHGCTRTAVHLCHSFRLRTVVHRIYHTAMLHIPAGCCRFCRLLAHRTTPLHCRSFSRTPASFAWFCLFIFTSQRHLSCLGSRPAHGTHSFTCAHAAITAHLHAPGSPLAYRTCARLYAALRSARILFYRLSPHRTRTPHAVLLHRMPLSTYLPFRRGSLPHRFAPHTARCTPAATALTTCVIHAAAVPSPCLVLHCWVHTPVASCTSYAHCWLLHLLSAPLRLCLRTPRAHAAHARLPSSAFTPPPPARTPAAGFLHSTCRAHTRFHCGCRSFAPAHAPHACTVHPLVCRTTFSVLYLCACTLWFTALTHCALPHCTVHHRATRLWFTSPLLPLLVLRRMRIAPHIHYRTRTTAFCRLDLHLCRYRIRTHSPFRCRTHIRRTHAAPFTHLCRFSAPRTHCTAFPHTFHAHFCCLDLQVGFLYFLRCAPVCRLPLRARLAPRTAACTVCTSGSPPASTAARTARAVLHTCLAHTAQHLHLAHHLAHTPPHRSPFAPPPPATHALP